MKPYNEIDDDLESDVGYFTCMLEGRVHEMGIIVKEDYISFSLYEPINCNANNRLMMIV